MKYTIAIQTLPVKREGWQRPYDEIGRFYHKSRETLQKAQQQTDEAGAPHQLLQECNNVYLGALARSLADPDGYDRRDRLKDIEAIRWARDRFGHVGHEMDDESYRVPATSLKDGLLELRKELFRKRFEERSDALKNVTALCQRLSEV